MNIQLQIIKGLLKKETYNHYAHLVSLDVTLKDHYTLLCSMHESIDRDITIDEYLLRADQLGLKYLAEIKDIEVGHETALELIRINSERSFCHRLGLVCMEAFEGRKTLSDVSDIYAQFEQLEKKEEIEFITDDFDELEESVDRNNGLKWRLASLQLAIGGLTQGDFGFIFARPETGKTTFLASEVSHMAEWADSPILWINNEEKGKKVKSRIAQASLGMTTESMFLNKTENQKKYLTKTKGNIKLYDRPFVHKKEIEILCKELKPSLILIDQIDKVKGFKADREDLRLGALYNWAREIAKEYAPFIGVCQAAASGENKRWLEMDDVAKSKTEKAAEADFIIGIGKRHDVGEEQTRFIHLIKNKITGNHAKITCRIQPTIARYEDL